MQAKPQNLSIKSFVPILDWLPKYDKAWLRGDIIAAITVFRMGSMPIWPGMVSHKMTGSFVREPVPNQLLSRGEKTTYVIFLQKG